MTTEPEVGDTLIILSDTQTGDWKTALARPKDFPVMEKGTEVKFKRKMTNFYGHWYGVEVEGSDYIQDIRRSEFRIKDE